MLGSLNSVQVIIARLDLALEFANRRLKVGEINLIPRLLLVFSVLWQKAPTALTTYLVVVRWILIMLEHWIVWHCVVGWSENCLMLMSKFLVLKDLGGP